MNKVHIYWLITAKLVARWRRKLLAYTPLLRRRRVGLVALLLLITLGLTVRLLYQSFTARSLSEGIVGVYTTHNLPPTVTNLISQPLVTLDATGHPQPALAESWQVNNDATEYTFTLRDNLTWSDGTKLKASDLSFNLPNISVSYPDDKTLLFHVNEPYSPLPSLLTNPVLKNDRLIGLGKYQVRSVDFDADRVKVTRMVLTPLQSGLPDVTIRFYQDEKTAKTAFWIGEIQAVIGLSDLSDIPNTPVVEVKGYTNFQKMVAVFFNTKDPLLADKNLRKALSFATPKFDAESYAKTPIPPQSWAYNNQVRDYIGHLDQAKPFFEKVKIDKGTKLVLTTTPQLQPQAEKIVQGWKSLGIEAVTRVESGVPQNFQATLLAQTILPDPDQYLLWHSTAARTNIAKYKSDRVDKDLEDARKTADQQTRTDRYIDFQKVLADDMPATFLYFPKHNVIYLKKAEQSLSQVIDWQFGQSL